MTAKHYLGWTGFAARVGMKPGALGKYKLPEPDVVVGDIRWWSEQTIDEWNAARPGHSGRPRKTA
ncbi:hypothetical protein [Bifidobacterium thermacidophilum]|uniref:Gp28 phagic protein n=1 Tax=Bifidobacterium thermacidophilum subsp. thermacidophilum TaxID=79262 RepID=A0A087E4Y7_9BIFI|nr:hypothetical protein [Bifidobacterium thermacidophilum]KFJ02838.1 hypothetical protein THER5_1308 [Bifidobacterium thermacidophilum subsp. thermacidophilum]